MMKLLYSPRFFWHKPSLTGHELARIIKELLMENISIIEMLNLNYKKCHPAKLKNYQLAFIAKFIRQ